MNEAALKTFAVARPKLNDDARIIVISDIHGTLAYLRGLTEKLRLRADDQLIFLGDLVEKGPESLGTLRYVMALRRGGVGAVCGREGWKWGQYGGTGEQRCPSPTPGACLNSCPSSQ